MTMKGDRDIYTTGIRGVSKSASRVGRPLFNMIAREVQSACLLVPILFKFSILILRSCKMNFFYVYFPQLLSKNVLKIIFIIRICMNILL